ncbi:hypothetical protein GCM10017668_35330 [Streptomyces tuirus]|uniref:Thioesterase domain-containing protein n=1 Tax=Streptomyces tuirus TaxID=68278 RepID=A0A7G1NJ62_9ACTN|nr:hypothetical protein GCM10017668_35330 [Streptomyces tuirus]
MPPELMASWHEQTTGGVTRHVLPGDHFFLHGERTALLATVSAASAVVGRLTDPMNPTGRKDQ